MNVATDWFQPATWLAALTTQARDLPQGWVPAAFAALAVATLAFARASARARRTPPDAWRDVPLRAATRRQRHVGWAVVLLFFGGGGLWAWLAPLASAAVAPGVVSPEGKRKTVQHLEGGIIRAIHVREGSPVREGAPLVTLEDVRARADHQVLGGQHVALLAALARLEAERAGAARLAFPPELERRHGEPEVDRLLEVQRQLFEARKAVRDGHERITAQRVAQLEAENEGLAQQVAAGHAQLRLIDTEIKGVQGLYEKGLERLPRLMALQRTRVDIQGQQGALKAKIASNEEAMSRAKLEDLTAQREERQAVGEELDATRGRLDEVLGRLPSTEDALARTVVRAPTDGEVVDLRATTVGGVLRPGEPILDLLPSRAELLVEARLPPASVKDVRRGLPARVVLTAYPQRNLPIIRGVVREVSADRLVDEHTGQPYFEARVAVDAAELAGLDGEVALMSGMPAEVMIVTGERTFLDYLLRPLYDAGRRAFRER